MIIREEATGDVKAIGELTKAAFEPVEYSDQTEHLIVERLRRAGAMTLSLVAEVDGAIVGHIAFSPVVMSGGEKGWFGLGPLSVAPDQQGNGIGSKLVHEGIARLEALGAEGCVVAGDPSYYGRFGFRSNDALTTEGIPQEYFMALALHGKLPSGIVQYHPGFYGDVS